MFKTLIALIFIIFGFPAHSLTCKLTQVIAQHELNNWDFSALYETVLVELDGHLSSKEFIVRRISFENDNMPFCYGVRGEWRCGSKPTIKDSLMLGHAKLERHASAKLYLSEKGNVTITYANAYVDNARAPNNQVTFLNDVYYFRGEYECK